MRISPIFLAMLCLVCSSLPFEAVELAKIDRSIIKEPRYKTEPYYALLVFGPKAEKRVWLVVDGDVLYVDRNGNGDLTEPSERVAVDKATKFDTPGVYKGKNSFDLGAVAGLHMRLDVLMRDKDFAPKTAGDKKRVKDHLEKGWEFGTLEYPASNASLWKALNSSTPDSFWRYGEDSQMSITFCRRPADAQICYFNGPLTFSNRGLIDKLQRDSDKAEFRIEVGTLGLPARSSDECVFAELANWDVPENVHPVADFEFPHKDVAHPPIKLHVVLDKRCCGSLFYSPVRVPPDAASGKGMVTVSFPAWKEGNVAPATFEVRVEAAAATSTK